MCSFIGPLDKHPAAFVAIQPLTENFTLRSILKKLSEVTYQIAMHVILCFRELIYFGELIQYKLHLTQLYRKASLISGLYLQQLSDHKHTR